MIKKFIFILFILFFLVNTSAITINIPDKVSPGGEVVITGKANPNEKIKVEASFVVYPEISGNTYSYELKGVEIPKGENHLKLIAKNVKYLSIEVFGITIKKDAINGEAIIEKNNIPSGTFDITLSGEVLDKNKPVILEIYASTYIKADSNGNIYYKYKIPEIPTGTIVKIKVGDIEKNILVGKTENVKIEESKDTEPPTIEIIEPNNVVYSPKVPFKILVKDKSKVNVLIWLNNNKLNYSIEGDYYTGELKLKEGINILKIYANDEYNNKNVIEYEITYNTHKEKELKKEEKPKQQKIFKNNTKIDNTNNKKESNQNNQNSNQIINTTKNISYTLKYKIIMNSENATLIVDKGTTLNTKNIIFKKVKIENISLTYYVGPNNLTLSKPAILKIKVPNDNVSIKSMYYNPKIKTWLSIPFKYDNNSILIEVKEPGYYGIILENPKKPNNNILGSIVGSILMFIYKFVKSIFSIF